MVGWGGARGFSVGARGNGVGARGYGVGARGYGTLVILVSPPVPIGLLDLGLLWVKDWDRLYGDWNWD